MPSLALPPKFTPGHSIIGAPEALRDFKGNEFSFGQVTELIQPGPDDQSMVVMGSPIEVVRRDLTPHPPHPFYFAVLSTSLFVVHIWDGCVLVERYSVAKKLPVRTKVMVPLTYASLRRTLSKVVREYNSTNSK